MFYKFRNMLTHTIMPSKSISHNQRRNKNVTWSKHITVIYGHDATSTVNVEMNNLVSRER